MCLTEVLYILESLMHTAFTTCLKRLILSLGSMEYQNVFAIESEMVLGR